MDPLSISANIITLIQATNEVVAFCFNYAAAAKGAPWALSKMIDELKSLRNVLESIEQLSRSGDGTDPATTSQLGTIKALCGTEGDRIAKELKYLDEKLRPPTWASRDGSKRKAFAEALIWPLKEGEIKSSLQSIERYKSTLGLALTVDQT